MAISGVNSYNAGLQTQNSRGTLAGSNNSLKMDDFFTLLSAQMQNQTMFNPMQDTEFIGQMAQFSALQQMQQLGASFASSMAASFIGKYATLAKTDELGQTVTGAGIVEQVNFTGDSPLLLVDGTWFTLSSLIDVRSQAPAAETLLTSEIPAETAVEILAETPAGTGGAAAGDSRAAAGTLSGGSGAMVSTSPQPAAEAGTESSQPAAVSISAQPEADQGTGTDSGQSGAALTGTAASE